MEKDLEKVLRYWRVSLADSALGDGKFSQRERKRFIEVSSETVRSGILPKAVVDRIFTGQKSAKSVAVRFWPLVMARKSSHHVGVEGDWTVDYRLCSSDMTYGYSWR